MVNKVQFEHSGPNFVAQWMRMRINNLRACVAGFNFQGYYLNRMDQKVSFIIRIIKLLSIKLVVFWFVSAHKIYCP